jgi:uncharacterized membrane protein HdeD (DUF308 family)
VTDEHDPMAAEQARPAAGPPHARRRPDPLLLVLAGVVAGVVVAVLRRPQPGMLVIAATLAIAAVLRLVLRPRAAGSLVVRSRQVDVAVLAVLAAAVGALALVTPFPAR